MTPLKNINALSRSLRLRRRTIDPADGQLESVLAELILLREDNARLNFERHRGSNAGALVESVRDAAAASAVAEDKGDDAWHVLTEAMVMREVLMDVCRETERCMLTLQDRLRPLEPGTLLSGTAHGIAGGNGHVPLHGADSTTDAPSIYSGGATAPSTLMPVPAETATGSSRSRVDARQEIEVSESWHETLVQMHEMLIQMTERVVSSETPGVRSLAGSDQPRMDADIAERASEAEHVDHELRLPEGRIGPADLMRSVGELQNVRARELHTVTQLGEQPYLPELKTNGQERELDWWTKVLGDQPNVAKLQRDLQERELDWWAKQLGHRPRFKAQDAGLAKVEQRLATRTHALEEQIADSK